MSFIHRSNLKFINISKVFSLFILSFFIFASTFTSAATNEFHPIPVLQGSTSVNLQPIESVELNSSEIISFGMPFPKGYLTDLSSLRVFNDEGEELPIFVKILSPWRDISSASDENSFRSVLIQLEVTYLDNDNNGEADLHNLTVEWGGSSRILDDLAELNTRSNWRLVDSELYSRDELVFEPPVYAVFSSEWYGLSVIKTRLLPKDTHPDFSVYEDFSIQFSNTALKKVDPRVSPEYLTDYKTAYASWLFDRAMTLYQIAFKSGDYALLRESHRASHFFANHINSNGYFDLRSANDLKYSHAEGIATNFWLTGDDELKNKISSMVNAFDSFNMSYSLDTNFWTERHAATALSGYVVAFEVLGESELAHKATDAFSTLYKMQNEPASGITATGGLMHTSTSHGEGANSLMSSPWMSVLLIDAVERYYIHSSDEKVKDFTLKLADYIAEEGLYSTDVFFKDTLPAVKVPYYMAGDNFTDYERNFNPWADVEHTLDVSKIFALAHFFDTQKSINSQNYLVLFSDLFKAGMEYNLSSWIRPPSSSLELGEYKGGATVFRLSPPRKFNWWFRTTANLDWLIGENTRFTPNSDINSNEVSNPVVELQLSSNIKDANENDVVTFTLEYKNTGNETAINTILLNKFLTNSDYYEVISNSISDNGVFAGDKIYWNIGSVNSNAQSKYVSFQVKVLKPDVTFSKERPSPSLISLASTRYGSADDSDNLTQPSTSIWNLGKYTHSKLSNTSVVNTTSFIQKLGKVTFSKSISLNEDNVATYTFNTAENEDVIDQYSIVKQPSFGIISGTFPELIYTPESNFYGMDRIEITLVKDSGIERGMIYYNVLPINDIPIAEDLSLTTNKNIPLTLTLDALDVDGDKITFSISNLPNNGSIEIDDSVVTYKPNHDYLGNDEFTYQVSDGETYYEAIVSINVEDMPEIHSYIETAINKGELASWIGNDIINRITNFEHTLLSIEELSEKGSTSELELLKLKSNANSLLLKSLSSLKYITDTNTKQLIEAQINDVLYNTSSSNNDVVIQLSDFLYEQSISGSIHTYALQILQEYLVTFDYYFDQYQQSSNKIYLTEAITIVDKAVLFTQYYIDSNPENEIYSEIYEYFNQSLRELVTTNIVIITPDDSIVHEVVNFQEYIENAIDIGALANWVGTDLLKRVDSYDNQVLIVEDLITSKNTNDLVLLKAKHKANMLLNRSYAALNYTPDGEVLQNIIELIKISLFDTLSSDSQEIHDLSNFLYVQMRDNTVHPYLLSTTKEYLIYIDYYIERNDLGSARTILVKAEKTLQYYLNNSPDNEVYKEISNYYEESIKPLIN